jgi:hypothetical protein
VNYDYIDIVVINIYVASYFISAYAFIQSLWFYEALTSIGQILSCSGKVHLSNTLLHLIQTFGTLVKGVGTFLMLLP